MMTQRKRIEIVAKSVYRTYKAQGFAEKDIIALAHALLDEMMLEDKPLDMVSERMAA